MIAAISAALASGALVGFSLGLIFVVAGYVLYRSGQTMMS